MTPWATAARLASRYRHLTALVAQHGERYPKRHGNWIKLSLTPDVCLTMDSWSDALFLRQEPANFANEVTGFSGSRMAVYLGIDFGGISVKVGEARLEAIIRAVESTVAEKVGAA